MPSENPTPPLPANSDSLPPVSASQPNSEQLPATQLPSSPLPSPPKTFPTKKLIIGIAIAIVLIIIGLATAGFFLYQKSTNKDSAQNQSNENSVSNGKSNTASDKSLLEKIFPKSYSSCFSSYNKKFIPSNIGNYQMADPKILKPLYQDILTPQLFTTWMIPTRLADVVKVNWALQSGYGRVPPLPQSQNKFLEDNLVIISVVNLVENDKYNDQVLTRYNKLTLEKIGDLEAAVFSQNGPNTFQNAGSAIITNIPKTNVFISMTFANSENAREFFISWLKTVCS